MLLFLNHDEYTRIAGDTGRHFNKSGRSATKHLNGCPCLFNFTFDASTLCGIRRFQRYRVLINATGASTLSLCGIRG